MEGTEVKMARKNYLWPETPAGRSAIWTRSLGPCQCIATFNTADGERTLTHLPGGDTTESYYDLLASVISDTVVVFLVNGDVGSKEQFEGIECPKFKKGIVDALVRDGKGEVVPKVSWITLWTERAEDEQKRTVPGTFVLEVDGRYGRGKYD
ncbi:hypothetical protein B0T24DRAFT_638942 [Lasiosphaeria ovina]|uniref:Uncharacterized protein n=1 Tax=Lasiosphaeria ovina TaxID=92902 RepID=A0AAE0JW02_9PEZI|nr:hypothetical protein B0T24DRAFT_638942 [Lasiosphaeria ovina]